jgi:hypothetical protein
MQSKKLSTTLGIIRTAERDRDNDDHFREANEMTNAVTNFLKSP